MAAYTISCLSALSILLPLSAIGWKWKCIWGRYHFLIALIISGGLIELLSYLMIRVKNTNHLISNIYPLLEFVLLVCLFKRWPAVRNSYFHFCILLFGVVVWIADNLLFHSIYDVNSFFRLVSSLMLVWVCIDQVNLILLNRTISIIRSDMLICIAFLMANLYQAFIEVFLLYTIQVHTHYFSRLWMIHNGLNILTNLMITIAFLCHRTKPTYSILSSQH